MIHNEKLKLNTYIKLNNTNLFITIKNAIKKQNAIKLNDIYQITRNCLSKYNLFLQQRSNNCRQIFINILQIFIEINSFSINTKNKIKNIVKFIKYQRIININEFCNKLIFSFLY